MAADVATFDAPLLDCSPETRFLVIALAVHRRLFVIALTVYQRLLVIALPVH